MGLLFELFSRAVTISIYLRGVMVAGTCCIGDSLYAVLDVPKEICSFLLSRLGQLPLKTYQWDFEMCKVAVLLTTICHANLKAIRAVFVTTTKSLYELRSEICLPSAMMFTGFPRCMENEIEWGHAQRSPTLYHWLRLCLFCLLIMQDI